MKPQTAFEGVTHSGELRWKASRVIWCLARNPSCAGPGEVMQTMDRQASWLISWRLEQVRSRDWFHANGLLLTGFNAAPKAAEIASIIRGSEQ